VIQVDKDGDLVLAAVRNYHVLGGPNNTNLCLKPQGLRNLTSGGKALF
jgi:hypothetical protein